MIISFNTKGLFAKIFITLAFAMGIAFIAAMLFFKLYYKLDDTIIKREKESLRALVPTIRELIELPIDEKNLESIANKYKIKILVTEGKTMWKSHHKIPPFAFKRSKNLKESPFPLSRFKIGSHQVTLVPNEKFLPKIPTQKNKVLFNFIIFIVLIIALTMVVIRKVLIPIKKLDAAVQQVADGNLETKLTPLGISEFDRLVETFNLMTIKIKDMLESRNQLLIDVAHELRTPLTRSKLALEFIPDSDEKKQIKEDIVDLEKIISSILESERFGNKDLLLLEDFNIEALINDLQKKFPFLKIESSENYSINGDYERLKLLFKNLIENAVKYSVDENKTRIELRYGRDNVGKYIQIKDNGIGVKKENLKNIFEPFYRADPSRNKAIEGHGLGLYMCQKIIKAHGGHIEFESVFGQGSLVTVYFK